MKPAAYRLLQVNTAWRVEGKDEHGRWKIHPAFENVEFSKPRVAKDAVKHFIATGEVLRIGLVYYLDAEGNDGDQIERD